MSNTSTTRNDWKTSDIQLSKDSQGCYEASHRFQGYLYEGCYFPNRKEARRAAVEELTIKKENQADG